MLAHLELSPRRRLCLVFYRRNDKVSVCICGSIQTQSASDGFSRLPMNPVFRDDFLKLLQEFVAEYEMTILFATHLDDDLSRVADYVIDVKNGEYSMREMLE